MEHVVSLVNPTVLAPGARKDLLNRLPEAERAITDGQDWRDLEATSLWGPSFSGVH